MVVRRGRRGEGDWVCKMRRAAKIKDISNKI